MRGRHIDEFIQVFKDSDICPCGTCLIKMVCLVKCKDYEMFCSEMIGRYRKTSSRYRKTSKGIV